MAVSVHYLSNGIPVLIDRVTTTECATAGIYFGVGSRYELPEENGAAHNLEHMAFKGTKTRTARQIIEQMENLGADTNAYTGQEGTMYYMAGLASDTLTFAKLLSDIAANSTLPKKEMEIERGAIIQEIGMYQDQPGSVLRDHAQMTAFPGQPLGATILGPVSNIQNFKRSTLQGFRDKHYHAGNMVISVAGNVDPAQVVAAFEKGVGHMPKMPRSTFEPAVYVGGHTHIERPMNQVQLRVQFKAAAEKDADVMATKVLASVLGGGMSSRLFTEIREKRGLVYGIGAGHNSYEDVGLFTIGAGTGPDQVATLIPILCDELNKVRTGGITKTELKRAKAGVKVGLAQAADSLESRMHGMPRQFLLTGRVRTPEELMKEVDAVTVDSVKDAANKIFAGTPNIATIGMGKNIEAYDKIVARLKLAP